MGICASKRLNIVDVTLAERKINPFGSNLYVIETANIDSTYFISFIKKEEENSLTYV